MATKARENHREDVAGRANVEDTPELLAYYDELERLEAGALWTVANKIEPWAAQIVLRSGAVALRGPARACAALGRTGVAREGRPARHLSEQSRAAAITPPRSAGSIPACR